MDQLVIISEVLSHGDSKLTRSDMAEGVFSCPILAYGSDGEGDQELAANNLQLPGDAPAPLQPFNIAVAGGVHQPLDLSVLGRQPVQTFQEVNSFMAQSSRVNPLLRDGGYDIHLENVSGREWIDWLLGKGHTFFLPAKPGSATSTYLRKLAGEIQVLPPGNPLCLGDVGDKSHWGVYITALVREMLTVEEGCSSEVRDAGVFVLTTWPYARFLELMAQELDAGNQLRW